MTSYDVINMAYVGSKVSELYFTGDRKEVLWSNWHASGRNLPPVRVFFDQSHVDSVLNPDLRSESTRSRVSYLTDWLFTNYT
jgi:hypothetical protein